MLVTAIQFAVGLLVAVLLNQRLRGTRLFRALFFLPVILGVTIQGLVWRLFLYPLGGPVDILLGLFGVQSELLGGTHGGVRVGHRVQIWANMGITMVIFLAGSPDRSRMSSSRRPGSTAPAVASPSAHVTWPLLTPGVNTNLMLCIIGSLQAWQLFLVLTGYRPGTQVMGYVVYAQAFGQTTGSTDLQQLPPGLSARQRRWSCSCSCSSIGVSTLYLLRRREQRLLG